VDGDRVREGSELQQILVKREVGDIVKLGVVRGEAELNIEVELVKREDLFRTR
jgi:S1-C subfamily serine protease